jgi:GR25 family glycosyltransferase involved in LPS biosynthesis
MSLYKYYIIHGPDTARKEIMLNEFAKSGISNNDVKWIIYPNKDDITEEMRSLYLHPDADTCVKTKNGLLSCTYKHYLALKDIVDNNYEYGIIMEDNCSFINNVPNKLDTYIKQLNENYPDWDILFDLSYYNSFHDFIRSENKDLIVHKSNMASRCAQFYLVSKKGAKILCDNWLPIKHVSDHYFNILFKRNNMKTFWAEPPNVVTRPHSSSWD